MDLAALNAHLDAVVKDRNVLHGILIFNYDNIRTYVKGGTITLNAAERREIVNSFDAESLKTLRQKGIGLRGQTYTAIRADSHAFYLTYNKSGLIIVRTKKYIVAGSYLDSHSPALAVQATEECASLLEAT